MCLVKKKTEPEMSCNEIITDRKINLGKIEVVKLHVFSYRKILKFLRFLNTENEVRYSPQKDWAVIKMFQTSFTIEGRAHTHSGIIENLVTTGNKSENKYHRLGKPPPKILMGLA